ncbi:unnamed protein product [Leptosia nina]|uniref:Uncharacterized protein n=1 Tax=Leptosia nina TaxID=320188 RepID=A0AAV1JJ03_9NEOP
MDNTDTLLAGLASGDRAPVDGAVTETLKRDQDSMDDFEHLDRENKKEDGESPLHIPQTKITTQNFIDMERDVFMDTPRAPSVTEKSEHLADKFTDSESDAGESPLHRPDPAIAREATPEPSAPVDPTPVLIPAFIPEKKDPQPEPKPEVKIETSSPVEQLKAEVKPISKPEEEFKHSTTLDEYMAEPLVPEKQPEPPKPAPAPAPPAVVPEPVSRQDTPRGPTAHIIEAEVIFCQMGLGSNWVVANQTKRVAIALSTANAACQELRVRIVCAHARVERGRVRSAGRCAAAASIDASVKRGAR